MKRIEEILIENPVIAAVRNDNDLEEAVKSKAHIIFVLYGNIINISNICKKIKEVHKMVFVHLDLVEGLKTDPSGIEYIKEFTKPDGIITTKSSSVRYAKNLGLYTIQRVFVVDSLFLKTGVKNIHDTAPNAVEVMPGIASKMIETIEKKLRVPIIAGGLIKTKKDVVESLGAGAIAISTSAMDLWNL